MSTKEDVVEWIAAGLLALVGVAHTVLGERQILRPLLARPDWAVPAIPRSALDPLMRFAWHLTTIAWCALAAALVGVPIAFAFAATCLTTAGILVVATPGHIAWPLFAVAGLLVLWTEDAIPRWALWSAVAIAAAVALVAAGFHIAWACGVRKGTAHVIPQRGPRDERAFLPHPMVTLAVAIALIAFVVIAMVWSSGSGPAWVGWLVVAALVLLCLRVVGDGRWMGVTKRHRDTGFARADDRMWTPAVATLALGAAAALALA